MLSLATPAPAPSRPPPTNLSKHKPALLASHSCSVWGSYHPWQSASGHTPAGFLVPRTKLCRSLLPAPTPRLPGVGSLAQPLPHAHGRADPPQSAALCPGVCLFLERKRCAPWRKRWWPSGGHIEQGSERPCGCRMGTRAPVTAGQTEPWRGNRAWGQPGLFWPVLDRLGFARAPQGSGGQKCPPFILSTYPWPQL